MKNTQQRKKSGFTLVELLVVIAILAILATVSIVGYTAFIKKANQSNANTEAYQVKQSIEASLLAGEAYKIGTADSKTYYVAQFGTGDAAYYAVATSTDGKTFSESDIVKSTDITKAFAANEDFADLCKDGVTFVTSDDGKEITYTTNSTDKIGVIIDLNGDNSELK